MGREIENTANYYKGGFRIHRNLILNRETKRTVLRALDGVLVSTIKKVIKMLENDLYEVKNTRFRFKDNYIFVNNKKSFKIEGLEYLKTQCEDYEAKRIVEEFKEKLKLIFNK